MALLAEPDSIWLKPVAGTGEIVDQIARTRFSIDPDNAYGSGVCGHGIPDPEALHQQRYPRSTQGQRWQQAGRETGVVACVAVPLIKAGQSIGVLMFFVGKIMGRG